MINALARLNIQAMQLISIIMTERSDTTNLQSSFFNLQ
ncbi:hypothetical protein D1AOALGA4SA_8171 [Olavius algarvensis Delta 1 endosymbiont]|nr:hypothetical protein D1AOALGA4SA_8171 [Olavius algarvensis Delta 1 endosymbiont]